METIQGAGHTQRIKASCPRCPNQDGIIVTVKNGRITRLDGNIEHPVSRGYICIKGRHSLETIYHPHRFKRPLLKTTQMVAPDWDWPSLST